MSVRSSVTCWNIPGIKIQNNSTLHTGDIYRLELNLGELPCVMVPIDKNRL